MKHSFFSLLLGVSVCLGNRFKDRRSGLRGSEGVKPPRGVLQELEEEFGREQREAAERKLHEYEKDLQATFKALPKNDRGAINSPSVRYALHRLFNQRYGWQIKGLENSGGAWDAESPLHAMGAYVPPRMRELFEERLGSYGLDLHELAVLAATLDSMFRLDVEKRLSIILQAYGKSQASYQNQSVVRELFKSYLSNFVLGSRVEVLTAQEVRSNENRFDSYPRREPMQRVLDDVINTMVPGEANFSLMVSALQDFGGKVGGVEDKECKSMKALLVSLEQRPGSGRVQLKDFYHPTLSAFFTESISYLRDHGMLDETDPEDLSVIIPNYLHSPSNCVTPSGFYEICCFDECEAMMDRIEVEVAAPVATPERVASVVALLDANRDYSRSGGDLNPTLKRLLRDIADYHGGSVPIHGRLFGQWMHQAFPRECAHPHEGFDYDRFNSSSQLEYSKRWDDDDEKKAYLEMRASLDDKDYEDDEEQSLPWEADHTPIGMWKMTEQLVDHKGHEYHINRTSYVKDIFTFGAAGIVGTILLQLMIGPSMKDRRHKDLKLL